MRTMMKRASPLVLLLLIITILASCSLNAGKDSTGETAGHSSQQADNHQSSEPAANTSTGKISETSDESPTAITEKPGTANSAVNTSSPTSSENISVTSVESTSEISVITTTGPTAGTPFETNTAFPEGSWKRTDVIRACSADLDITNTSSEGFDFTLIAFRGDHFGELYGTAQVTAQGQAAFAISASDYHGEGILNFHMDDLGRLILSFHGDLAALAFGMNVLPDGVYVSGEPEYESDGYPMLVFGTDWMQKRVKQLMVSTNETDDETAYNNLIVLMREGLPELAEPGHYKGFLPGRTMGANLYISPEDRVYLLAYGLDDREIVFYTTDINYLFGEYPGPMQVLEDELWGEVEVAYDGFPGLHEED